MPEGAGDQVDREAGDGAPQRLPGPGGHRLGAGGGQGDHLVDDRRVEGPGDDRDGLRVARGYLGVLSGEVAVFAEPGADPGVFQFGGAGQVPQGGQGDVDDRLGAGPGPAGQQPGPQQQRTRFLQRVVEPLRLGPVVIRARLLPQRFQHRPHIGGALRGQVTAQHRGPAEGDPELQAAVGEAVPGGVGVGLPGGVCQI